LGETEWLEEFIYTRKERLKANERVNTTNLGLAFLHFAQCNYDETVKLTNFIKREFPNYALVCWTLEIRASYMLKEQSERWNNLLNNFYAYLRRHEDIREDVKTANYNFISLIRQLYKANYQKKYNKHTLFEELQSKEQIVCKRWLKNQIEQLK